MFLKLLTPPTELPLTLEEVKMHLRVDGSEEDEYIDALQAAAVEHVQNITNRQLMRATYLLTGLHLPAYIPLPRPPFGEITEFKATNSDGVVVEFLPDYYTITEGVYSTIYGLPGTVWYDSTYKDVSITYTAGYETAADVPKAIKQAILLIISDLYENRTDKNERFPKTAEMLLNSYRIFNF